MFGKEAERKAIETCPSNLDMPTYVQGFVNGAEFGYKLAHEEMDYLNKHWKSEEERKANEWHYNGAPENENDILCQIDKDIFVVGYFHQKNKQYYTTSGEWLKTVIAWKEIVLPKESE